MFKENRSESTFKWENLGDIKEGRPNMGDTTSATVYRLMQFSLRDVLIRELDPEKAARIFYDAGEIAGREFASGVLDKKLPFEKFVAQLQDILKTHGVGILRVEKADLEKKELTLAVYEDLDCSGLPISDETVCEYDEGFLAGVLNWYTGINFNVKEIDCWANGGRCCRFQIKKSD